MKNEVVYVQLVLFGAHKSPVPRCTIMKYVKIGKLHNPTTKVIYITYMEVQDSDLF